MAVTSTIEYCTDRDLQDIYPHLSKQDLKRRIINCVSATPSTHNYTAYNTGLVTVLFADGVDLGTEDGSLSADGHWKYLEAEDKVEYYNDGGVGVQGADPNTMIMEAGDDWATITQRIRRKASRLVESRLDYRMAREVMKDREDNYPEIIVHATALQAVILLLKSHDPNNEVITPFQEEYEEIIDGLSAGRIVLPTQRTADSSKGIIREVSVDASTDLFPVELKGNYSGTGYELLKIKIVSGEAGVIGTTKMTVTGKGSESLKSNVLVDSEIITGDYQNLGVGSLQIRWGGDSVINATTTNNDEYEIELWGSSLDASMSSVGSINMTRR